VKLIACFRNIVTGPSTEYLYVIATHGIISYSFIIWICYLEPSL
jgi:hypothetical protein